MKSTERKNYWPEVPTEERGDWLLIEVGEEMRKRLDSMIDDLIAVGTRIVAQKESKIKEKRAGSFLIKAMPEEPRDFVLSVSLPEGDEACSIRVETRRLSSKVRSVELGWQGEKMLGLRVVKGTGDLAQNPPLRVEIRDRLRHLLEARQARVKVGVFVIPKRKTWRTLEEGILSFKILEDDIDKRD